MEYGGNEDEAIAALLHDAVEDQGGTPVLDEIRRRFGQPVAETVLGCSDSQVRPKPPWQQRKQAHVDHVRAASPSVRMVVAADKLDNARSLLSEYRIRGESLWDFFHGGRDGDALVLRRHAHCPERRRRYGADRGVGKDRGRNAQDRGRRRKEI